MAYYFIEKTIQKNKESQMLTILTTFTQSRLY